MRRFRGACRPHLGDAFNFAEAQGFHRHINRRLANLREHILAVLLTGNQMRHHRRSLCMEPVDCLLMHTIRVRHAVVLAQMLEP